MNRSPEWFAAGAAGSCPGLWALRGTLGTIPQGRGKKEQLIEPRHIVGADGRCKHCGEGKPR